MNYGLLDKENVEVEKPKRIVIGLRKGQVEVLGTNIVKESITVKGTDFKALIEAPSEGQLLVPSAVNRHLSNNKAIQVSGIEDFNMCEVREMR